MRSTQIRLKIATRILLHEVNNSDNCFQIVIDIYGFLETGGRVREASCFRSRFKGDQQANKAPSALQCPDFPSLQKNIKPS